MVVTSVTKTEDVTDLFSVDYIEETETRVDLTMRSRSANDTRIVMGNKRELKQKTAELLIAFLDILSTEKYLIDIAYEDIQDKIFKLKTKEKDIITDRLKALTDEEREIDTILKITKQGDYSKGLQKGLTMYDKDFYEKEQNFRDVMEKAERKIRNKNKDATDGNIDILLDEYMEQNHTGHEIDNDAFDMSHLGENFYDGYFDGVDAPEEDYEDYANFDS
jgi:ribosomal protein S8